MAILNVICPGCSRLKVIRHGKRPNGELRYSCCSSDYIRNTFLLNYRLIDRTP
ncbi:MAG: hypothetical protein HQL71_13535 [Magnetococcales bacterium]|nr:hypothetical protein [Magnetococcales bacterium]